MTLSSKLFGIAAAFILLSTILFVIFGQATVRKLRKNPETRDRLGLELASGWDIVNVASTLSVPGWLNKRRRNSQLALFAADEASLYAHTNKLDRILGRLFFYTLYVSVFSFLFIAFIDWIGLIE